MQIADGITPPQLMKNRFFNTCFPRWMMCHYWR